MKATILVLGLGLLGACGGDGGTTAADTVNPVDTSGADGVADTAVATDTASVADTATAQDTATAPDGVMDVVTGDKAVGEPCAADAECTSGICLSSSLGTACTAACARETDCDGFPIGMFCLPVRPGRGGCVPEADLPTVPATCADHGDCAYPLYCRTDGVGCDLPECLHDGDCAAGNVCETATRQCQPATCSDDVDCRRPGLVCADDQTCAPPNCTTNADCGALPNYCQPAQHACKVGLACEDEDGCFYNEQCAGGFCVPDLCWNPCQDGKVCDPASGWCGAACTGPGQGGCPSGQACLTPSGVCAPNTAPVAVADVNGASVALVTVGQAVALSGAGSIDPEGEALTYRWVIVSVPAGSATTVGSAVGAAVTASFTPDVAGRFVVGLYATDPAGLDSVAAAVTLIAR